MIKVARIFWWRHDNGKQSASVREHWCDVTCDILYYLTSRHTTRWHHLLIGKCSVVIFKMKLAFNKVIEEENNPPPTCLVEDCKSWISLSLSSHCGRFYKSRDQAESIRGIYRDQVLKEEIFSSGLHLGLKCYFPHNNMVPTVLEKSLNFGFSLKSPWKWICPWKVLEFRGPSLNFQLEVLDFLFCVFWTESLNGYSKLRGTRANFPPKKFCSLHSQ